MTGGQARDPPRRHPRKANHAAQHPARADSDPLVASDSRRCLLQPPACSEVYREGPGPRDEIIVEMPTAPGVKTEAARHWGGRPDPEARRLTAGEHGEGQRRARDPTDGWQRHC